MSQSPYLESALNLAEYREAKNKLVNQKQVLKDKINALQENPEQGRDFLKKIGSNFQILDQKLIFDFKNPWEILALAEPRRGNKLGN